MLGGTARHERLLRILVFVTIGVGVLGVEIQERYLSSPVPEQGLGRTVATFGRNGDTVYVAPYVRVISASWVLLTLAVLVGSVSWPAKEKKDGAV